jgi:pimeloyl-ACP methyl ester carboxylesterase
MATFVLVHGSWAGSVVWRQLAPRLRKAGHEVYAPTLTGIGARKHLLSREIDLDTHIQDVIGVVEDEDLSDIVLIGNSYGGMVITGVADRAGDRIGHLVYLDALIPVDGEAAVDYTPAVGALEQGKQDIDGVEMVLVPDPDNPHRFGVEDPAIVAWMAPRLAPHPWRCFTQPLRIAHPELVAAIPQSHIVASPTLPDEHPERVAPGRDAGRLWFVETGHDLMLSAPDTVTDLLLRLG